MNTLQTRILSVIIPCYNEAPTIAEVVEKVRQAELPEGWQKEIIVVDDGSGPATLAALKALDNAVVVIYLAKNAGKGATVKAGLRKASGDYCIIQDADLELDPGDYAALVSPIDRRTAEVVFGYRVLADSHAPVSPLLFWGGRALSLLFNIAFGTRFRDIPACYKVFPRAYVPALIASPSDDFVFDSIEMTHVLSSAERITQVPIRYFPRTHAEGKKLRLEDGLKAVVAIFFLRLGFRTLIREAGTIARFLISGGTTVAINLAALYILTDYVHVWYLASAIAAFIISYSVNFLMQKYWTFQSGNIGTVSRQLPLHFSLALFNLGFDVVMLYVFVEWFGMWYIFAQILASIIIALESYFVSKRIFSPPVVQ